MIDIIIIDLFKALFAIAVPIGICIMSFFELKKQPWEIDNIEKEKLSDHEEIKSIYQDLTMFRK